MLAALAKEEQISGALQRRCSVTSAEALYSRRIRNKWGTPCYNSV